MTAPCPLLGFRVTIEPAAGVDGLEELTDAWLHLLERRGLHCTGGGGLNGLAFVVVSDAAQATENDRDAARSWLDSRRDVSSWQVGDLEDLSGNDR
ncbi:MAG: DUF469 family protein [Gemmatimonadaceae bacterium]|nr:DUF469 family protein [Gemmatimonadaceae bacterium]